MNIYGCISVTQWRQISKLHRAIIAVEIQGITLVNKWDCIVQNGQPEAVKNGRHSFAWMEIAREHIVNQTTSTWNDLAKPGRNALQITAYTTVTAFCQQPNKFL